MGRDTFDVHDAHFEHRYEGLCLVLENAAGDEAIAIPMRVLEQLRRWLEVPSGLRERQRTRELARRRQERRDDERRRAARGR